MVRLVIISVLFSFLLACEESHDGNKNYVARIVGFDPNCSTCILEFPEDSVRVKDEIGQSRNNYYIAVNMARGEFKVGQMVKADIRKAAADELKTCIALYPSNDYQNIYVSNWNQYDSLLLNDTVSISFHDCLYYPENQMYLCLDSVSGDSRCPKGVYCFWAGNAAVRFKLGKCNEKPVIFTLNTNSQFATYETVDGFIYKLISLSPYPTAGHKINQKDYKAELVVTRE